MLATFLALLLDSHTLIAAAAAFVSWAITTGWYTRAGAAASATVAAVQTDVAVVKQAIPAAAPVVAAAKTEVAAVKATPGLAASLEADVKKVI